MIRLLVAAAVTLAGANAVLAQTDTIRIAYLEPLSGGGANVGEAGLRHFQFYAEKLNAKGGIAGKKIEIVGFDNKTNPQETLLQAQKAIDQGIRIFTQGNGSAVAAALIDFIDKHNERNPGKEAIYLNYAAIDPTLTNEKCSYWHFRWDAHSDVKMAALTTFMKSRPGIKKVYLFNQDYSFGQSVRSGARRMLAEKRPDIEIVGDELHALLKIADFAPYIAKIKASGADSVITGNWGLDFSLLLKAAGDAGLTVDWYTYYANGLGGPTALKQAGLSDKVFAVMEGVSNSAPPASQALEAEFRARYGFGFWLPRVGNEMNMLASAAAAAASSDVKAIAAKLEDMKFAGHDGSDIWMRKDDHQIFQNLYIASFGPLPPDAKFDEEKTGWGWKLIGKTSAADTVLPTTCKMNRPS